MGEMESPVSGGDGECYEWGGCSLSGDGYCAVSGEMGSAVSEDVQ